MLTDPSAQSTATRSRQPATLPWWLLAWTYYVACCLMHLRFSLWLVRQREAVFGATSFAEFMPVLVIAIACGLIIWIAMQLRTSHRPRVIAGYWLLWLLAAALNDRFLTFSINEYFHYPQYAILALLVARAIDPQRSRWYVGRILFWVTLMGMGDELLQYTWITISYSEYLDFNDFIVNLVAAFAGVLLYYGPANSNSSPATQARPVLEYLVASCIAVAVLAGLQTGRIVPSPTQQVPPGGVLQLADGSHTFCLQRGPDFYGAWQNGPRHGRYYVMPPIAGFLSMLLLGTIFSSFSRHRPTTMPSPHTPVRTGPGAPHQSPDPQRPGGMPPAPAMPPPDASSTP